MFSFTGVLIAYPAFLFSSSQDHSFILEVVGAVIVIWSNAGMFFLSFLVTGLCVIGFEAYRSRRYKFPNFLKSSYLHLFQARKIGVRLNIPDDVRCDLIREFGDEAHVWLAMIDGKVRL
jgi:hypothetical protein